MPTVTSVSFNNVTSRKYRQQLGNVTGSTVLTRTSVQLAGLSYIAGAELDPLTNLRSDNHAWLATRQDGVQVVVAREGVAGVVHDAAVVVLFAQRVHVRRRQLVEVVLLACSESMARMVITEGLYVATRVPRYVGTQSAL